MQKKVFLYLNGLFNSKLVHKSVLKQFLSQIMKNIENISSFFLITFNCFLKVPIWFTFRCPCRGFCFVVN